MRNQRCRYQRTAGALLVAGSLFVAGCADADLGDQQAEVLARTCGSALERSGRDDGEPAITDADTYAQQAFEARADGRRPAGINVFKSTCRLSDDAGLERLGQLLSDRAADPPTP